MRAATRLRLPFAIAGGFIACVCLLPTASVGSATSQSAACSGVFFDVAQMPGPNPSQDPPQLPGVAMWRITILDPGGVLNGGLAGLSTVQWRVIGPNAAGQSDSWTYVPGDPGTYDKSLTVQTQGNHAGEDLVRFSLCDMTIDKTVDWVKHGPIPLSVVRYDSGDPQDNPPNLGTDAMFKISFAPGDWGWWRYFHLELHRSGVNGTEDKTWDLENDPGLPNGVVSAYYSFRGTNPGVDTIRLTLTSRNGFDIDPTVVDTSVSWGSPNPPTLTLSAPSPRSSLFTGRAASFRVSVGGVSDATGSTLSATIAGVNPKTVSATVQGTTATFSYSGSKTGADRVQVSGTIAGRALDSNRVSVKWLAGANSPGRHFGDRTGRLTRPAVPGWPDPINAYTGNYYESSTDVDLPGSGVPLSLDRTYNSLDTSLGVLGRGWSASLFPKLSTDSEGNVHLKAGDGQEVDFALLDDGSYAADSDVSASLTKTAAGFDLLLRKQAVQHFNADGRLVSWLNPNGQGLHFSYGSDGRLASVADAGGRELAFAYDDRGHLKQITLPDGSTVSYGYEGDFLTTFTDQLGSLTRYTYDGSGDLTSVVDPTGKLVVRNSYDDQGRVTAQTDALGNTNTYDWSGNSGSGTDATGSTWEHRFTDAGQLSEGIDPLGNEEHYVYDEANNLLSTTDALGNETTMTYDERGNMLTSTDALEKTESFTYNGDNQVTSSTDQLGRVTHFTYDPKGNLVSKMDPSGAVTTNEYDAAGRLVSTTDPLGRITRNVYDAAGNLTETISPSGAKTTMSYDSLGQELSETDSLGNKTSYKYDATGRVVKTTNALGRSTISSYDAAGRLASKTDALGNTTSFEYDAAGHQISETAPGGSTTRSTYDAVDNLTSTTDALGNVTHYEYDALGRQTAAISPTGERTSTKYDANGNTASSTDALGNTTTTTYDDLGRAVESKDPLGRTTKTVYDNAGNVIKTTDPIGHVTTSEYDAAGHEVKQTDALGHATTSTYDNAGQLTDQTDANAHTTHYAYDANGQKILTKAPDGSITKFDFDAGGNLIRRTDANGHVTTYSYNSLGQKTEMANALGAKWTYAYDANGNLVRAKTPSGGIITQAYDSETRLIRKSYSDGTAPISFTYDANGRKASMTDAIGTTTYAYDSNGNLISISRAGGTFLYRYDANGNLLSRKYPNGLETTYGYDSDGEMVFAIVGGKTTRYTYDADGNLASTLHSNGILDSRSYNAIGRLTEIGGKASTGKTFYSRSYTYDAAGNPLTLDASTARTSGNRLRQWQESYSYDANDRLTKACMNVSCKRFFEYSYDPVGNRTKLQTKKATTLYSYDTADELVSESTGKQRSLYSYDPNGNETRSGSARYDYNLANELTQLSGAGEKVSYTYTGDGLTAKRSSRSEATSYAWDTNAALGDLAMETDTQGRHSTERTYTYGESPLGVVSKGDTYTFHTDSLGSVVALSDDSGRLVESYRYTPYGESYGRNESARDTNPIGFTGQYLDSASDLYNMRARQYDPGSGRFLQTDPLACDEGCGSSYAYAEDQPTVMVDPSGAKSTMPSPPLHPSPKSVYVTFFVYGMPRKPNNIGRSWRWESINGSGGSGGNFICNWNSSSSTFTYAGGWRVPWVYDDASSDHGDKQGRQESNEVKLCARTANGGKRSGYEYLAADWTRRPNPGGVVKRFYAELYDSHVNDPGPFLRRWTYSKGSPVVSANTDAVGGYVGRVCEKLHSGQWMGIWNGGGVGSGYAISDSKLTAIENALNECTGS